MGDKNDELNSLLTKMGRPTVEQTAARRRWANRVEWGIILAAAAGFLLTMNGAAVGIFLLLGAAIGFVVHSRDREGSFMALIFLLACMTVVLGTIGSVFDIPWLMFGSGGESRGITGGWEY